MFENSKVFGREKEDVLRPGRTRKMSFFDDNKCYVYPVFLLHLWVMFKFLGCDLSHKNIQLILDYINSFVNHII